MVIKRVSLFIIRSPKAPIDSSERLEESNSWLVTDMPYRAKPSLNVRFFLQSSRSEAPI